MAYIVNTTETALATNTTYQVTLGTHAIGDLLLICMTQDGGGATAISPDAAATTAGWAMVGTQATFQGARQAWAYLVADSASETNPTFTTGAVNDGWIGTCLVIRDADATTPVEGWMRSDWGNSTNISTAASNTIAASSAGGTTIITPTADSLAIYSWASDGSAIYMRTKIADAIADSKRSYTVSNETVSHIICHNQLATAAIPDVTMYSTSATEGGNGWVLSIKNASGGITQKQARVVADENTGISNWFGNFGAVHLPITWQKLSTFVAAAGGVQTITVNGVAITASDAIGSVSTTIPQNESPWGTISNITSSSTAAVELQGGWYSFTDQNLSGKIITFNFELNAGNLSARVNTEGMLCALRSSDGNYAVYQLRTKAQGWAISQPFAAFIDVGNSTTAGTGGTFDATSVDGFALMYHRAASAGTDQIGIHNLSVVTSATITGGGEDDQANFKVLADDMFSWGFYRWADVQGLTQVLGKFNTQIGNGSHATYFDSAPAFEFARAYSSTSREWNVNANRVSLDVYAKSGDTINLAAGIVATETAQAVTINASSATTGISVAGQAFKGLSGFTDNAGIALTGPTYKECGTVSLKANMTGMSVSKTVGAVPAVAVTANSKTLQSCTIDLTGTSATYHLSLSSGITAITLNAVTLTGTPATDKIYSALASGTLTITLDGTGTSLVAGDVTFVGGSTAVAVIAAPAVYQKVTVSGITTGARVQIYDTTSSTELFNGTASAGDTVVSGSTVVWTDPTAAAADRAIRVRVSYVSGATAKNFIETSGLTCGQTAGTAEITYPVSPTDDTVYNANAITGSGVTGVTFTDAATDVVNINVVANAISWKTIYAAWVYYVFGATGIASDIDYIDAVDEANYILSNLIIKNTSSPTAPLEITGGYGRDATTGATIDLADTTGGTLIFAPDHVVSYAVGSGVTAQDITDIAAASGTAAATATLAAAQTTPIHADIRKVNSYTVDGVGSEADPWGPAP